MAGAYRMALSGASVEVTSPEGEVLLTHQNVTVSVRDGIGRLRKGSGQIAEMPVPQTGVEVLGRKRYRIVGEDGTVWDASKDCGCGGGG